jgi:dihydroxy-acid dehydratase
VLHISPESAVGGTLALVQNSDFIELDVEARRLHLDVPDAVLQKRKAEWKAPEPQATRGYAGIYLSHVEQADKGADLDILVGKSGSEVSRDLH